jgi:glutamate-1-semialdehyde 2,1-aminomutase
VKIVGKPCCLSRVTLDQDGRPSLAFRTLLLQETIKRVVLMPSLAVSYSHTDEAIDTTTTAIDGALEVYRRALDEGVERYLVGRPVQAGCLRSNQSAGTARLPGRCTGTEGAGELAVDPRRPVST